MNIQNYQGFESYPISWKGTGGGIGWSTSTKTGKWGIERTVLYLKKRESTSGDKILFWLETEYAALDKNVDFDLDLCIVVQNSVKQRFHFRELLS